MSVGSGPAMVVRAVSASWADLTESLFLAGVPPRPDETHREFVERVGQRGRLDGARLESIAEAVDAAHYAPDAPSPDTIEATREAVGLLEQQLDAGISWQERLKRRADPRVLVGVHR